MDKANVALQLIMSVQIGDTAEIQRAFEELDLQLSDQIGWPEEWFETVLSGLESPVVQKAENPAHLLLVLAQNKDLLSEGQLGRLLTALEHVYPRFKDPAALMLMLEFLCDHCPETGRFLEFLGSSTKGSVEEARALIAYGLQVLARRMGRWPEEAQLLARTLTLDPSPVVRREALAVLKGLSPANALN